MSILSSIKEERKMTFKHWRFRLLHWAFNVKNPDPRNPEGSGMPKFLYTHFCPLFHLTNLIAILSPFIFVIKVLCVFFCAAASVIAGIDWSWFGRMIVGIEAWHRSCVDARCDAKKVEKKKVEPTSSRPIERNFLLSVLLPGHFLNDFEGLWCSYSEKFTVMSKDEVLAVFNELVPKIVAARELAKKRKQRLRETLIFWTNFSRVFLKWALNIFYGLLAVAVAYGVYASFWPVIGFFQWVGGVFEWAFSDGSFLAAMIFLAKIVGYTAVFLGICYVVVRIAILMKFGRLVYRGLVMISPPFYLVGTFFEWADGSIKSVGEFVAMFYEENCPPIMLLTEEEAKILQGEEEVTI